MKTRPGGSLYFKLALMSGLLLLASCGGGGGGGGGSTPVGTGSVGVVLTDKPAELSEVDKILISITGVELLGADDGNRTTLYSGPARGPFDLLELEDESRLLTFDDDVPSGSYCKIRLTLSDLTLVFNNGDPDFHPHLPGNNKLDLNARECFHVAPGSSVYLQLDMDAKSIHVVQTGNGKRYNFRPVVFIDVMDAGFDSKLVRLEDGTIRYVDSENGTLLLCDFDYGDRYDERTIDDGSDDCVIIAVDPDATAAFDNVPNDGINTTSGGDAIPLAELLLPERIGTQPVTVVGRLRNHPEVEHHDDDDDADRHHYPKLEALVVELGNFLSLDGNVANDASNIRFNMNVAPGQVVSPDAELPVALQATVPPVNGTRIMTPSGDPLASSDITVPRDVVVDGVLALSSTGPDYLNSALVIVDTSDNSGSNDVAHGYVAETSADGLRLKADDFPCEAVLDAIYDVGYLASTTVYVATSSGGFWSDTGYLQPRQEVDISGNCSGTTLLADIIIVLED